MLNRRGTINSGQHTGPMDWASSSCSLPLLQRRVLVPQQRSSSGVSERRDPLAQMTGGWYVDSVHAVQILFRRQARQLEPQVCQQPASQPANKHPTRAPDSLVVLCLPVRPV